MPLYAHDASLPTDFGLIVMRPGKPNRVPEASRHRASSARALEFPYWARLPTPGSTEAGDMVWIDSHTLLIGHGYRTNSRASLRCGFAEPKGVEGVVGPAPLRPRPLCVPALDVTH